MAIKIPFKSGGDTVNRIMPSYISDIAGLSLKDGSGNIRLSNTTTFYTAVNRIFDDLIFDTASLTQVADTNEQTIVDISGQEGILTQVKSCPITAGGNTITIRVTADGVVYEFSEVLTNGANDILCLGDFSTLIAGTSVAHNFGQVGSFGYQTPASSRSLTMLSPRESMERGGVGIPFKESLKVTIQGSSNLVVGSTSNQCAVCWYKTKPQEFS